jgi:hypothetical protein
MDLIKICENPSVDRLCERVPMDFVCKISPESILYYIIMGKSIGNLKKVVHVGFWFVGKI